MRRIDIDFIRRRRLPLLEGIVLAIAMVVLAVQIVHWRQLMLERDETEARIDVLQHQIDKASRLRLQRQSEQRPEDVVRHAETLKTQAALAYPWESLLSVVARPDAQGVALLSFNHDADVPQVRLTVEAINMLALAKYVAQLNEASTAGAALQWYVASYQIQSQGSPSTIKAVVLTK